MILYGGGGFLILAGWPLGSFLKNIWYNYDEDGSLANQPFDWFVVTDHPEENLDSNKTVIETLISDI